MLSFWCSFMPSCSCLLLCASPCRLAAAVMLALVPVCASAAPDVEFNRGFLQGGQASRIDLSRFERGEALPGTYRADIRVNGVVVARRDVELRGSSEGKTALCISFETFSTFGVDAARLAPLPPSGSGDRDGVGGRVFPAEGSCGPLERFVPQATADFDAAEQVLDVSIPQAFLARDPRGWVSPELWDSGINAGLFGYSVSHQQVQGGGVSRQFTSAVIQAGVNTGAWRLRHDGYLSRSSERPLAYRAGRSYVQRSIASWGAELTLGESSTRGDVFDAVSYRGISVSSDPRMLPDSQRDYAPVVRGVAQSSARVVIRQRDHVLYQTNVAAGPFEINDLYGTGYAGDLDVEVLENDGRVHRFTVPFAAIPELLRAGQQRYSATAGVLNDTVLSARPVFAEATARRGLSNRLTSYGGLTASEGYAAVVLGAALNTGLGAFSGDTTLARIDLGNMTAAARRASPAQSYRLSFSRFVETTSTNLSIAAYRFSTDGYLSLEEAARTRHALSRGDERFGVGRQRSRLDVSITQPLGGQSGSLYASGSSIDYWNLRQRRSSFSVGYANTLGWASYSVSAQRIRESRLDSVAVREGNSLHFNLTVPLGSASGPQRVTAAVNRGYDRGNDARVGLTGSFGERNEGSYNAAVSRYSGQAGSYDAGVSYRAAMASISAGYNRTAGNRGMSVAASGGLILHGEGVTLAQQMGETMAVIQVPNAAGAVLDSGVGLRTDRRGFAVVPYMTPFRRNEVTIDPKGLSLDVELKTASVMAVPTAGAVVKLLVPTSSGRSALIEVRQRNGQPLPFGMDVRDAGGGVVGVVGQASRLWVRGIEERGVLSVRWGEGAEEHCEIAYDLGGATAGEMVQASCLAETDVDRSLRASLPQSGHRSNE